MGFYARHVSDRKQAEEAHSDSPTEWGFMNAMSVIKIKERRCTRLTCWMGFHAGYVSDQYRTEEVHITHELDGFHAGRVSDRNQGEEADTTHDLCGISCRQCQSLKSSRGAAHNSLPGWDFIMAMSVIEIEPRCTMTDRLECGACQ